MNTYDKNKLTIQPIVHNISPYMYSPKYHIMRKLVCLCLLTVFICFTSSNVFAQDAPTTYKPKRFAVKIEPIKALSPDLPVLQVGGEFLFHPKWSVEQSIGFNGKWFSYFTDYEHQVFTSRTELRYYLKKRGIKKMKGMYVAAEAMFGTNTYEYDAWFARRGTWPAEIICIEKIDIKRRTFRPNFKFGYQLISRKGFVLDAFAGPGFNFKQVTHVNRVCQDDAVIHHPANEGFILEFFDHKEEKVALPSFAFGCKIGWAF